MAIRERLSGNEAVATAMKQINPDTVAAYPITPATEIPQYFANFVSNGSVTTEFIPVESEHSAMSACIGASAAGARVMTATSSQGLAYMFETLYIASGLRLPIVLVNVNRALSAPINIHNDHSDSMGARDAGFIQLYCESNQEAYDNTIMAVKIAEKAKLPVMVCYDGFITSHSIENIMLMENEEVKNFVGEYNPEEYLLDDKRNISIGPLSLQNSYFEQRKEIADAMVDSKEIIKEVSEEFYKLTGRKHGLYEKYMLDDAELGIIVLNSTAGTAKEAIDVLRSKGVKAGLLKPRCFRPLPYLEISEEVKNLKVLAIMDKADSVNGYSGPLFSEITSAMYTSNVKVPTVNYIYGLGGRDVKIDNIFEVFSDLETIAKTGKITTLTNYLGLRGE
ncbi:MAG: pyruvate flavodoxin/ferredoxin oxidoreductase domain protein [Clostridia bacterium]|jgi:pyruvate ferredoxin oxidoreductase alpha subunit|nr:pyruvate flavodoxin/ferredoxin oxidoreductase domain protein [Clostridia bacterium]